MMNLSANLNFFPIFNSKESMSKDEIWIVDDDPILAMFFRKLLSTKEPDKKVLVFKNGKDALEELKKYQALNAGFPKYIILDIEMPIMDGYTFLEETSINIPDLGNDTSIYICSCVQRDALEKLMHHQPVKRILEKPLSTDSLKNIDFH